MLDIVYQPGFLKRLSKIKKASPLLFEEVLEKVERFKDKDNHKALKVHKLRGRMSHLYSFSINYKIRIIFKYAERRTEAHLLDIGNHNLYQ